MRLLARRSLIALVALLVSAAAFAQLPIPAAFFKTSGGTFTCTTYATWNPADADASISFSGGNLTITSTTASWASARATIGKSSGKWYWEVHSTTANGSGVVMVGIATSGAGLNTYGGHDAFGYAYEDLGYKWHSNSAVAYGTFYTSQTVGVALDMDGGTLTYYLNGVSQGTAYTGISGTFYPIGSVVTGAVTGALTANFGATAFSYTVPTGYTAGMCN